jgi:hypothetical protein
MEGKEENQERAHGKTNKQLAIAANWIDLRAFIPHLDALAECAH